MKKYSLFLILLFSLSIMLFACGTNEAEPENEENNAAETEKHDDKEHEEKGHDLLGKIKDEGKLTVGTEGTYAPFTFHDESGELTGFDVEISKEVAKRMGVEAEFSETQWDAMFAGLDAERFDMVANQVGIRPDRQEKYDFSNPYITSKAVLITHEENESIKSFEDIKGLRAAQSMTSNYGDIAREYGAEIVGVEGFMQSVELINSKRADVTINDNISFLDYKKKQPDAPVKIVAEREEASQSGLMFRKGNETLVEAVNKALQEMIDDGTYEKISEKWFGENVLK
ncbi:amino acid ABC transporter substrate-binding protein [Niallia endozanthoxylica]|uniref:Amino acid ABC transporter substrate-binding protein n=1 Tax=Niallia endozanthoxylica TaxID=2036016 RepID=A0A5J5H9T2_9BACI|nr:amino acid ABC transporter substrate-binding protein [Niallia endozanthoxylica]KAA9017057.1 amino acid ABC transporter substrate-binding protein [Niallia endozanthoxylica]